MPARSALLGEAATARRRLAAAGALGAVVGASVAAFLPWQLTMLLAFDVASMLWLADSWRVVLRADADATSRWATRQDDTRRTAGFILLTASTISLAGVFIGLSKAVNVGGVREAALTAASLAAIVLAWLLVNTHYTFHYAGLYYEGLDGGVVFPGDEPPRYLDFAYLAFTVGMTYQVSDNDITDRRIRDTVLRHSVLAYVFGAVIIATAINIGANFVH